VLEASAALFLFDANRIRAAGEVGRTLIFQSHRFEMLMALGMADDRD